MKSQPYLKAHPRFNARSGIVPAPASSVAARRRAAKLLASSLLLPPARCSSSLPRLTESGAGKRDRKIEAVEGVEIEV